MTSFVYSDLDRDDTRLVNVSEKGAEILRSKNVDRNSGSSDAYDAESKVACMGTLAIDIETASPFREPARDESGTEFYEWLSIAAAYTEENTEAESTVLFRRGDWSEEFTADLFDRFIGWCDGLDIERTLTYNGAWFDLRHMANWADALEDSGERPDAYADLRSVLPNHVDLAKAATARHEDELWEDQPIIPEFKAYELEGIDNDRIWYDDYELNADFLDSLGLDQPFVTGKHVGRVLGERYVDGVVAGLEETATHRELKRILRDYGLSDVVDLFALYESLGGETLDRGYHYPIDEIDR